MTYIQQCCTLFGRGGVTIGDGEESLKQLHIDSIPLFYQHRYDRNTSIVEVAEAICALETAVAAIAVVGDRYNAEQQKQVGY